ncbi:MASE3 domain-containing protein [Oceanispirochaeta sp. M2]|uniref:MASE3 domain-containing protein n=1 Tax=Oceanispirochaeta sp. M2 TaxID=2735869 RepID=UPI001557B235|nr:MASE3 domain-containing protein [Oceanispirochaeta sp. M2]MBF9017553.1 PAS domain S-box protein [Oceanispirochaeta sp. M2]
MEGSDIKTDSLFQNLIFGFVLLCLIYLLSQGNALLFHGITELFSISVAWSVFLLMWTTRKITRNKTLLFLGIAYLFIGFIDLFHTLSYKGMNVFEGIEGSNTAGQLWISARGMEAVSLLLVSILIHKKDRIPVRKYMVIFSLITTLILAVIYYTEIFPVCYIEGQGFTQFKTLAEYAICLILLLSIRGFHKCRKELDRRVYSLLVMSLSVSIASELAFTIYIDVYGFFNALGHFLKVISFGLIFQALVYSSVHHPYSTIFQELKKDTEELSISQALHSSLIANISDVLVILDKEALIKYISPNIENLYGWSSVIRANQSVWENVHPDNIKTLKQAFSRLIDKKDSRETVEIRYRRADGHYTDIQLTGRNLLSDSDINGVLVNFHDITERLDSETKIQESEERFRVLHNASFGGIAIHDKGLILECNLGLSEISGYEYNELIGMNSLQLIAEDSKDKVLNNIKLGYEKDYEVQGCRKNGEEYPLRVEARNIPYKGKPVRVVEFRDISREKQNETEKNRLKESLMQVQKMETVGRLAGGIAHDFNNMLGVILGYTDIIMENEGPQWPNYNYLNEIKKASQRSADLTRQLLAFARKQVVNRRVMDLNNTITLMIEMLDRLAGAEIQLEWSPEMNAGSVEIDPNQLNQILVNLCMNAKDEISGQGRITIETGSSFIPEEECKNWEDCCPGNYASLTVRDTGAGMDEDRKSHIFEPFFSIDFESAEHSGLALAAVYGCVRQSGGFINLESEVGKGSEFTIYLPRVDSLQKNS